MVVEWDNVNHNRADKGGQTPLFYGATNGQEEAVKILLELHDVNPNRISTAEYCLCVLLGMGMNKW